ncbi:MAG: FGGY family carbohydrate kinase [Candidatus Thorarchaeota archaeon]|nr:FGGY family carbohydrate kinase [Candidatus Thorarchaeota archaeon]
MSQRLFAVFDIGTTGTRSVIIDEEGREISKAYEEYPSKPTDLKTHEQLADTFWRTSANTMQRTLASCKHGAEAIVGVIVTTTRGSLTPLDSVGNALAPTMTWVDNRSSAKSKEMADIIGPRLSVNKMMWFIENRPDFFKKVHKWALLDAFINNRLCGVLASSPADARYGPIDHETLQWSEELCETTGIPIDTMVPIVNAGTMLGEITSDASKATGLRKGTPVIMGSGDQQCSALGMGVIESGLVKATTGTGTFVITHLEEFMEEAFGMYCNPSAIPDKWILEGVIPGTGLTYKWYRDQYCEPEMALAARTEKDAYQIIEASAASIPAGSDGLVVFPFMAYNLGMFYHLGFQHTKAHVARAILEANGYGINFYIEMMEGILDVKFSELRIDGGGANSPLWRQIQADCTEKPVLLPRIRDSTVIGAAMLGTVGTGIYDSYKEAVDNMYHAEERREPIPENVAIYRKQYKIFNRLLNSELGNILEAIT